MRDWAHSRRLGTPADEAGSVVLRQPPASKLASLFRIDVRDHALGLVAQQLGGRVTEHPPGGWLGPRTPSLREGPLWCHVFAVPEGGWPLPRNLFRAHFRAQRQALPTTSFVSAGSVFVCFERPVCWICLDHLRSICSDNEYATQCPVTTSVIARGVLSVGIPRN